MSRTVFIILLTFVGLKNERLSSFSSTEEFSYHIQSIHNPLIDGQVIRLAIPKTGVYQITRSWLREQLGEVENISFNAVSLYSIFGGHLNDDSDYEETERLQSLAFQIKDDSNGQWDDQDAVWFYAEGPDRRTYEATSEEPLTAKNPFSNFNYVFLKIGGQTNQVLIERETPLPITNPSSRYWYYIEDDEDRVNLLDEYISTQGSGQKWYGHEITNTGIFEWATQLKIPSSGLENAIIKGSFGCRSGIRERINLIVGNESEEYEFAPVNISDIEALYARNINVEYIKNKLTPAEIISVTYQRLHEQGRVWTDKMSVQGWAEAHYENDLLTLNNSYALQNDQIDGLSIGSDINLNIWEITNPYNPVNKDVILENQKYEISISNSERQSFIAFSEEDLLFPTNARTATITSLPDDIDMLIIAPDLFVDQANQIKLHREAHRNLTIGIVSPQHIFDIYSSGKKDPTAIRNYVRDLYYLAPDFEYLLLFGDASFDYRHINKSYIDDDLVPTFETSNSLDPLLSFPSDDYYALLDNDENGILRGDLDINVGRIPVSTVEEASAVVNKIIQYDNGKKELADWKSRVVFLADDEDNNLHINDADRIAQELGQREPLINVKKIYFDAYLQESTPGGSRYPSATSELNRSVDEGALIINYLGHGGPNGWAQERVLKIDDIKSWSNISRLPLIVTATCSFTGFDDPARSSAGEESILKPNGGALALFTTVRSVFASKNFQLTRAVFRQVFEKENNEYLSIGEIMRRAKNANPNDNTNARKFFLIGDPSIKLAIPSLNIITQKVNNVSIEDSIRLSALDQVNIEGAIANDEGEIMTDFRGEMDITVFDKPSDVQTLANDQRSFVKDFQTQQNVIFRGRTMVQNGEFEINFTVPIDIDYSIGRSKTSYVAVDDTGREAIGYHDGILIGGQSVMPVNDDNGPVIKAFINSRNFNNGDIVPSSNTVIVDLSDDYGINFSNTAIGHEISAVLDDDTQSTIFLNDFYQSSPDQPNSGTIRFNLLDLEEGQHRLTIKAFDVANNPGETTIEFVVSNSIENHINAVSFQPNPVSGESVIHIEHDLINGPVLIRMSVYDVTGQLIELRSWQAIAEEGRTIVTWAPELVQNGLFICQFMINSTSTDESTPFYSEKVVVLK